MRHERKTFQTLVVINNNKSKAIGIMRFFNLLGCLFFCQTWLSAQFCHPQDSLELVKFYNSTNGQNSTLTWDLSQPVSAWEWVELNSQGRVKSIWLLGKNLSGTLPELDLPFLTLLGLENNNIGGALPMFDLMPALSELKLGSNNFVGNVPIFDLPFLQTIDLHNNQLTGKIPNFSLPIVLSINLDHNQLSGEIPNFNTPNLGSLNLSHNQLTGSVPNFTNKPLLTHLYCQNNQLSGSLPGFENLANLEWLYFDNNQLSGSIPTFELQKLRAISLRNNQFDGNIPSLNLPELNFLLLGENQLSGEIPDMNLPKLFNLELWRNQLSGEFPDFGSNNLKIIEIRYNRFTYAGLEELVDSTNLFFKCAPQAKIPIHVSGNLLSVNAGGTLMNNTYFWFKDSVMVAEITDDSTFVATEPGIYFCKISNSILSNPISGDSLVLESDLLDLTVSTADFSENSIFTISPNPISEGQPFQILLENDFFGIVKFEILSLDGRVVSVFEKDKTLRKQVFQTLNLPGGGSFLVRFSDGRQSVVRFALKF